MTGTLGTRDRQPFERFDEKVTQAQFVSRLIVVFIEQVRRPAATGVNLMDGAIQKCSKYRPRELIVAAGFDAGRQQNGGEYPGGARTLGGEPWPFWLG